jgi:hypothetical protein
LALMQLGLRLKREWFRSVRAGIYEAREQHAGGPAFADALLATLVQSVNASAGAYYSVSEVGVTRVVNLGCEMPAAEAPLKIGEGLLGKVALDGAPLLIDRLEERGLRIRTGLLEITPRAALVFPVKSEQGVTALIELVFVGNGAQPALELLEYLGRDLVPAQGQAAPHAVVESGDMRRLQEELVIANARLEQMGNELQQRDRVIRSGNPRPSAQPKV